ncbi:uncharacterized protein LOC133185137 [Saccostrea echinata]|uniref:uncharacterized protein LOC133185137 n=1 Tax=Saccostrea echinata TaxID=191078 RepID=UPI002A82F893|nr:uncharacterized protein LOC133185137 [Saccostrea echinata]
MRGADASSDHELIRSKIRIKLKKQKQNSDTCRKKYGVTKLQQLEKRRAFTLELKNRFQVLEELESVEDIWENMIKGYNETADSILGVKEKGQKPWISRDSWKVVEERKQLKLQLVNSRSERLKRNLRNKYSVKDREVKRSMRNYRRKWTEDLITEAERAASNGHMKTVYEITRVISNEKKSTTTAIKDKEGKTLSSQDERKERWKEHFQEILNRPQPEHPLEVESEGQVVDEMDTSPIRKEEIIKAIKKLKNGKAGGVDGITAEIGITLLSVPSKVFSRIVIQRIQDGVEKQLREEQAGFRRGRSTTEQLFTLRNIIEQCTEWISTLFVNYVDFEKAFDSIHRESLWSIMKFYGIPDKLVRMVKLLYDSFQCAVLEDGEESDWFRVTTGVKQGCTMSGFLFLLVIDFVMRRTTETEPTGIRWDFTTKLEDLDFADDLALLSSKFRDIQQKTQKLNETGSQAGLRINIEKPK